MFGLTMPGYDDARVWSHDIVERKIVEVAIGGKREEKKEIRNYLERRASNLFIRTYCLSLRKERK
jgi:hypothetical protein